MKGKEETGKQTSRYNNLIEIFFYKSQNLKIFRGDSNE